MMMFMNAPRPATIGKAPDQFVRAPNLRDYDQARREFDWRRARNALSALSEQAGLNIAHECVDRHAAGPSAAKTAIRWLGKNDTRCDLSYGELATLSNRFANVLARLGVPSGARVFCLTGRVPELFVAALGTWKYKAVFCPLFSAFGPEPIRTRMEIGGASVLVTTSSLYRRKVAGIRSQLPALQHVLIVPDEPDVAPIEDTHDFAALIDQASETFVVPPTAPDDHAILHFTSGTTGTPKGAIHVHEAVVAHHATGRFALDLHPEDVYWCTADPGWVTGTSYGIIAPLAIGATLIVDEADFDASRWLDILEHERVSVWYTAPTAIRMMMKAGVKATRERLPDLRFLSSVGEPLNPEAVWWGMDAFGLPFHDNWWQTETGGIMIANFAALEIRPGSMGLPLPGIDAALVEVRDDGSVTVIDEPGREGEIALKRGWPSMFRGYLGQEARYRKCFAGEWYLTGDLAKRDADGYYWFVGRKDDVIKTSGHLIGPFEVESVLMEHPAVAEAGVIGKPDPVAYEIIKAFVSLKAGFTESEALLRELLAHARKRLGAVVAPKEIVVLPGLPKTRSGKIMRRLLKARELGLPEGDTSTLEGG